MSGKHDIFRARGLNASYPAPAFPATVARRASDADDGAEAAIGDVAPTDASGRLLVLDYRDSGGAISTRSITLRRVNDGAGRPPVLLVVAWCHLRRQVRSFRSDRILSLYDGRTGEVLDPLDEALALLSQGPVTSGGAEQGKRRGLIDGIRALMFLSRCDGAVHPSEMEVVAEYARERSAFLGRPLTGSAVEDMLFYADRQFPDVDTYLDCLERIARSDQHLAMFERYAIALVAADGVLTEEERRFVRELAAY